MGNSKASPVTPLPAVENQGSVDLSPDPAAGQPTGQPTEQPRDFHFAVTWVTLFAHLDPIEAAGPQPRFENPSPSLALIPVVAAPLVEQPRPLRDPHAGLGHAAWEMVVPKMIRTGARTFLPADSAGRSSKKPELL